MAFRRSSLSIGNIDTVATILDSTSRVRTRRTAGYSNSYALFYPRAQSLVSSVCVVVLQIGVVWALADDSRLTWLYGASNY
eukprot:5833165-Pleurochrysis_carterae.AAC.5